MVKYANRVFVQLCKTKSVEKIFHMDEDEPLSGSNKKTQERVFLTETSLNDVSYAKKNDAIISRCA